MDMGDAFDRPDEGGASAHAPARGRRPRPEAAGGRGGRGGFAGGGRWNPEHWLKRRCLEVEEL